MIGGERWVNSKEWRLCTSLSSGSFVLGRPVKLTSRRWDSADVEYTSGWDWSRQFFANISPGEHFNPMSWGWFGISVQKCIDLSCFQQSMLMLEPFRRSTVEWFSTLAKQHFRKCRCTFSELNKLIFLSMFVWMSVFVSTSSLWFARFAICFMMDLVGVKIGAPIGLMKLSKRVWENER